MRKTKKKNRLRTFLEIEPQFRNHLLPFFGNMRLSKVEEALEERWEEFCLQTSVPSSLYNHAYLMRGLLKWCKKKKYIRSVPDLEFERVPPKKLRNLTPDEVVSMFKTGEPHSNIFLFFSLAIFCGLRRNEALTLQLSVIHLKDKWLEILPEFDKNGRGRVVTIPDFVCSLIEAKIQRGRDKGIESKWLFWNAKDPSRRASDNGLKTAWKTWLKRAEIKGRLTWHELRATAEMFAHLSTNFTEAQKEKFFGSSAEVQKRIYVAQFQANQLRGLESVLDVEGLDKILDGKIKTLGKTWGGSK